MTDLEQIEASLKAQVKEKPEPTAVQCNDCFTWSSYRVEHVDNLPRSWRQDETGYHCNDCRKK